MQLLQVRAGLNAELVVEPAPDLAVGSQGVGLSIKSIQRHQLLFVKLFLKRMLCKQAVDLRKSGSVPAQSQFRFNLEPLRDRPHLLQAGDDRRCKPKIRDIREHLAAPETQPTCQLNRRLCIGVTFKGVAPSLHRGLEDRTIDDRTTGVEAIAAWLGDQDPAGSAMPPIRLKNLAQVEDITSVSS